MRAYQRNVLIMIVAFAATTVVLGVFSAKKAATPQETIQTFLQAAATGNGAKACAQLSPVAKRQVVASGTCVNGIQTGASVYSSIIAQLKIADLHISGDTATASSTLSGQPTATFTLKKKGGKWLIVSEQRVQAAATAASGSGGPSESRVEEVAACLDTTFGVVDNGGPDSTGGVTHVVLSVNIGGYAAAEVNVFASALAAVNGFQGIARYDSPLTTSIAGGSVIVDLKPVVGAKQAKIAACG